jgi:Fungal specific transcription factor domain
VCLKVPPSRASKSEDISFAVGIGSLGRPVATAIDCVIDPEEELLLRYVYSSGQLFMSGFFRVLASEYGLAIRPKSLRYALLAYAATELPAEEFLEKRRLYRASACQVLNQTLISPTNINDADLIASCMLMYSAEPVRGTQSFTELVRHAIGCYRILQQLRANSRNRRISALLAVFTPFALATVDVFTQYAIPRPGVSRQHSLEVPQSPFPRATFTERVTYGEEVSHALQHSVRDPVTWALWDCTSDYSGILEETMMFYVAEEQRGAFERKQAVENLVDSVITDICHPDFRGAVQRLGSSKYLCAGSKKSLEERLTKEMIQVLRGIYLTKTILKMPTILQGLETPEVRAIGEKVVSMYRSLAILRRPGERWFCFRHHVFALCMGALTLKRTENDVESKI